MGKALGATLEHRWPCPYILINTLEPLEPPINGVSDPSIVKFFFLPGGPSRSPGPPGTCRLPPTNCHGYWGGLFARPPHTPPGVFLPVGACGGGRRPPPNPPLAGLISGRLTTPSERMDFLLIVRLTIINSLLPYSLLACSLRYQHGLYVYTLKLRTFYAGNTFARYMM